MNNLRQPIEPENSFESRQKDQSIRPDAFESQLEKSLREQDTKFKRLYSKVKKRVSLGIFSDRVEIKPTLFKPNQPTQI